MTAKCARRCSWIDGTPHQYITATKAAIYLLSSGTEPDPVGAGFQITVSPPVSKGDHDTFTTVKLYAGVFCASGRHP